MFTNVGKLLSQHTTQTSLDPKLYTQHTTHNPNVSNAIPPFGTVMSHHPWSFVCSAQRGCGGRGRASPRRGY